MTRRGRRQKSMTCLSCGALLDSEQSFCDMRCVAFAREHGLGRYGMPKRSRGLPHDANKIRKGYR